MDPRLQALAAPQGGAFTVAQAAALGYDGRELVRLRRSGQLLRLRRGIYASPPPDGGGAGELHRLQLSGLRLALREPAVVSHGSAAVLLGMDVYGVDLDLLHVTRDERQSSRDEAGVCHHAAALPSRQTVELPPFAVTSAARTAVDLARTSRDWRTAVAHVDAAYRVGAQRDEVLAVLNFCRAWAGARQAGRAVSCSDPLAESVGESLCRVDMRLAGLPEPRTQVLLVDGAGTVGRVDFLIEGARVVVEFDGKLKYRLPDGTAADAADVLWREKQREDRIRALGYRVVRLVWADLGRPEAIRRKVAAAMAHADEDRFRPTG